MELEVVRTIAEAMADPVTGINAILAGVPRDAGDPAPPLVTIYEETTDDWVADRQLPHELLEADVAGGAALLAIGVASETDFQNGDGTAEVRAADDTGEVTLVIYYGTATSAPALAVRDALYTMRAVRRWFNWFFQNDQGQARERNSVELLAMPRKRTGRIKVDPKDTPFAIAFFPTIAARDFAPLPA